MLHFLKCLLQLILSPVNGWEDISLDDDRRAHSVVSSYYIFIGVVAALWLLQWWYHPADYGIVSIIELMAVTYVVFFVCYFFGMFVMSVAIESLVAPGMPIDDGRIRNFALYSQALLALVFMLRLALPATTPVIWFLPLYVMVIIWKGRDYLHIDQGKTWWFVATAFAGVLLPPILLGVLFDN